MSETMLDCPDCLNTPSGGIRCGLCQKAWDRFAAAFVHMISGTRDLESSAEACAGWADAMMVERRRSMERAT